MGFKAYPGADGSTPRLGGEGLALVASASFTTAASASIDGCFTAIHDHYLVDFDLSAVTGTDVGLGLRLRVAGVDDSGANYDEQRTYLYTSTLTGSANTGQTSFTANVITTAQPDESAWQLHLYRPYMARKTVFDVTARQRSNGGTQYVFTASGIHTLTTKYDGFTIYPASGTISGSLAVYGLQRA